ncbi:MAG TPA: FAD-dependent oxidoreductase [Candidatus Limnocylindria bacterium]|nr:FAD-dependent oxidoreductase [Candidatus Limnocylindria bacterium]
MDRADVVVIGGGIVGTSAAAFLAGAGARVILVEREGLASAASGANSGVVQHPFDPILAALYRETIDLYRELSLTSTSFKLADRPAGMLFVAEHEDAAREEAASITADYPELVVDVLDEAALQKLEPSLAPGLWACRAEMGYPVWPGASTYAYASLAEQRGVTIRMGRAAALAREGDGVAGVLVDGRLLQAGQVLVAAGPWSPGVVDPTGAWHPIRPLWGAVVEVELADPPRHVLEQAGIKASIGAAREHGPRNQDFSLVTMPGVSVVGSTFLDEQPDPREWQEPLLRFATRFVPGVEDAPIRGVRACPRPLSADGLPLIGAVEGREHLYICAGHGPWGISTGPASARLVTALMLGREPAIPPELAPERFGSLPT